MWFSFQFLIKTFLITAFVCFAVFIIVVFVRVCLVRILGYIYTYFGIYKYVYIYPKIRTKQTRTKTTRMKTAKQTKAVTDRESKFMGIPLICVSFC